MSSAANRVSITSSAAASSMAMAVAMASAASLMAASSMSSASASVWAISMAAAILTSSASSMASSASIFTRSSSPTRASASGAIMACIRERPPALDDGVAQVGCPVVLDDQDGRGTTGGDGLGELLEPVDTETGVALGDGERTQLGTLDGTLDATTGLEADEAARDGAQALPLVLGQVGQVHRVADAAVLVLLDEQDVDDPDHAALPHPAQLGHDARRSPRTCRSR